MTYIDERCKQYCYDKLVDVVGDADGNDLVIIKDAVERNEQDNKAIDELRDQCRARGA